MGTRPYVSPGAARLPFHYSSSPALASASSVRDRIYELSALVIPQRAMSPRVCGLFRQVPGADDAIGPFRYLRCPSLPL